MKKRALQETILGGVNVVPIIDVSLILLIILMVTNPFLATPNLAVSLPKAKTLDAHEKNLTITLTKDGQVALNTDVIPRSELKMRLAEKLSGNAQVLVILRADEGLEFGKVQEVLDMAVKQAGAKNVALGTEQPRSQDGF